MAKGFVEYDKGCLVHSWATPAVGDTLLSCEVCDLALPLPLKAKYEKGILKAQYRHRGAEGGAAFEGAYRSALALRPANDQ